MNEYEISNKVVVFSDTHFGVVHDPTEDERTNITDLLNLLDLVENEIRPRTIILLGDIFDLWRVRFEDAWDNAHDIGFFERLSKYAERYKDRGVEIIYIIGNHDHFFKEINYAKDSEKLYNEIKRGEREDREEGQMTGEVLTREIADGFEYDHVKLYYPHYKMKFDFGTVYFDHGHYNTKEERQFKLILTWVYKILAQYFSKSKRSYRSSAQITPRKIFFNMEGNFSGIFSLLYHSKLDDTVRGARDFIWRTQKKRWYLFSIVLGFIIPSLIYTIIERADIMDGLNLRNSLPYPAFAALSLLIGTIGPKILGALLPGILTNTISNMRGETVDKISPDIVERDISIEREKYTYLDLMKDLGNRGEKIDHYIFAHTHLAGKTTDKKTGLKIYNCGGWVEEDEGKSCTNSFILIDPDISGHEKIKIFHIDNRSYAECRFDKEGKCDRMCKK